MPALETALVTDGVAEEIRRLAALGWVNVKDYGATGDGSTDDTAAIQAAIDAAYAASIQTVFMPAGSYKTTGPLYLDPPLNLRSSLSTPTNFAFSLELKGVGGLPNRQGSGTTIRPVDNSFVALWIGPGQGMKASNFYIRPITVTGTGRRNYPTTGTGIAISGGEGGASRTEISCVGVEHYYYGVTVGQNNDALGDSNRFFDCWFTECYYGVAYLATQNYINDLVACNVNYCNIGVYSPKSKAVNVWGGNYSTSGASYKKFTISSVSALSVSGDTWTFTASVSSPDTNIANNVYDIACVETAHFGVVPVSVENYSAGTVTLKISQYWRDGLFGYNYDIDANTDIEAEIQACTSLFCAERITVFKGVGFHVRGIHIENPTAVATLYDNYSNFAGSYTNRFEDIQFNGDQSKSEYKASSGDQEALFRCQAAHPYISIASTGNVVTELSNWSGQASEGLVIESRGQVPYLRIGFMPATFRWAMRVGYNHPNVSGYYNNSFSRARGVGVIENMTWQMSASAGNLAFGADRMVAAPWVGRMPAPYTTPRLTPAYVDAATATPTFDAGPLLAGDTIYSVSAWDSGAVRYVFARNAAKFYTLGTDLSINWEAKGKSPFVYFDDLSKLFPGLQIVLNDGSTDYSYVITGVFDALGYCTVCRLDESDPLVAGTKTTTYTGSTVKQEDNRVRKYGRQCEFGTAAPTTGTWERGDIVYDTNVAAGGNLGWVCVSGGTPGTWKTFGAVAP